MINKSNRYRFKLCFTGILQASCDCEYIVTFSDVIMQEIGSSWVAYVLHLKKTAFLLNTGEQLKIFFVIVCLFLSHSVKRCEDIQMPC